MTGQHIPSIGLITLTMPQPKDGRPIAAHQLRIHDASTGEDIGLDTSKLVLTVDCDSKYPFMTADLTRLVDDDGNPIGSNGKVVVDEDGNPRTAVFRYDVAGVKRRDGGD